MLTPVQFYSIYNTRYGDEAVPHDGYYDGLFLYYESEQIHEWYAIDPECGMSVCRRVDLNACCRASNRKSNLERIRTYKSSSDFQKSKERFRQALDAVGAKSAIIHYGLSMAERLDDLFEEGA